jgi:hypothetical protein
VGGKMAPDGLGRWEEGHRPPRFTGAPWLKGRLGLYGDGAAPEAVQSPSRTL